MRLVLILFLSTFFISCGKLFKNTTVYGVVTDARTGLPLKNVVVGTSLPPIFTPRSATTTTNEDGEYSLDFNINQNFIFSTFATSLKKEGNEYLSYDYICLNGVDCRSSDSLEFGTNHNINFQIIPTCIGLFDFKAKSPNLKEAIIRVPSAIEDYQKELVITADLVERLPSNNIYFGQIIDFEANKEHHIIIERTFQDQSIFIDTFTFKLKRNKFLEITLDI